MLNENEPETGNEIHISIDNLKTNKVDNIIITTVSNNEI